MHIERAVCVTLASLMGCGSSSARNGDAGPDGGFQALVSDAAPLFGDAAVAATPACTVPRDEDNAPLALCTAHAPPHSFRPQVKWSWEPGPGDRVTRGSAVVPLVGNFTDDNGDGRIDLCDTPDVLLSVGGGPFGDTGDLILLSGDTGKLLRVFDEPVAGEVTPAFADMDGDGIVDVVACDPEGRIVLFGHDGKKKRTGDAIVHYKRVGFECLAISIYDLDGDGRPEILAGSQVFDAEGRSRFVHDPGHDGTLFCPTHTAADLDADGKLEVIFGNAAYRADGSKYFSQDTIPGQPHVANVDGDPEPEIVYATRDGLRVVEHDGTEASPPVRLTGEGPSALCWGKPAAIHDFDGDGKADLLSSTCTRFGVHRFASTGLTLAWSVPISDESGIASSTGFDFLGRGIAEAVYGDERSLIVLDGATGAEELRVPRSSSTFIEYPVVADVDNDGSADILVVSNTLSPGVPRTTIQVFQDEGRRWVPTRRIWNQHAYHVTNIREDGTVPRIAKKSWQDLNTFRTNAQVDGNTHCKPPVLH